MNTTTAPRPAVPPPSTAHGVPPREQNRRTYPTWVGDLIARADNDFSQGYQGNDVILGNDGADWIGGNEGADVLDGGNDNDHVFGGEGADTLDGGSGDDVLYGDTRHGRYVLNPTTGLATLPYWPYPVSPNILGALDDVAEADAGDDYLNGGSGNDQLFGGAGDDLVIGVWLYTKCSTVGRLTALEGRGMMTKNIF